MNKSTWSGIVAAMLAATFAQAQTTIDVAKISCDQFVLMTVAEPDYIAIWLSGYYHGKRNNTRGRSTTERLCAKGQKLLFIPRQRRDINAGR